METNMTATIFFIWVGLGILEGKCFVLFLNKSTTSISNFWRKINYASTRAERNFLSKTRCHSPLISNKKMIDPQRKQYGILNNDPDICDVRRCYLSYLGLFSLLYSQRLLNYLAFQFYDCTWWKLFQIRVTHTKFDIAVFIGQIP